MRLRGTGIGAGTAIGTAAVVRVLSGIALPPEIPPRIVQQRTSGRNSELPDVIVVAEDFRIALAVIGALSWANVVGIAAVRSEPNPLPSPLPAVTGVENLLEFVADDMLLLLDATHGVLLADPDPMAIAQYQAEADHLAPKRRLFLEDVHLPAQTLDGRTIQVFAYCLSWHNVESYMDMGPDGIYAQPARYIGFHPGAEQLSQDLRDMIAIAEGKPILVNEQFLDSPMELLQMAVSADLTLAVPFREDLPGWGLSETRAELEQAEQECLQEEIPFEQPHLATDFAALPPGIPLTRWAEYGTEIAAQGASGLIISVESRKGLSEDDLGVVETLVTGATANLLPTYVAAHPFEFAFYDSNDLYENSFERVIRLLIGTGANALIQAGGIQETKNIIRKVRYSDCREELLHFLQERKEGA